MTLTESVAAIDIGTNSVLLTIADTSGQPVEEHAEITRIGEGCDANGFLLEAAIERTLACIERYAQAISRRGATRVAIVATSATRDAANGAEFCRRVEAITGCPPEIVSGHREAELTFRGALSGLTSAPGGASRASGTSAPHIGRDICVFDIGGGSTELIRGRSLHGPAADSFEIADRTSLDIGSVRLTERFLASDPPTDRELDAVRDEVWGALAVVTPPASHECLVGVAGTVTTLCAIAQQIEPYDSALIHGQSLTRKSVQDLIERLARLPLHERRELVGLEPKRADVIVAGAILAELILSWAGSADCTVSDRGVRWGLIAELLRE